MPRDTTKSACAAGIVGRTWLFAQSPFGIAYACLVAATVSAWFTAQPLIGLSVLVCLIQVFTSPEFLLRARLNLFFWQDINAPNVLVFGAHA